MIKTPFGAIEIHIDVDFLPDGEEDIISCRIKDCVCDRRWSDCKTHS